MPEDLGSIRIKTQLLALSEENVLEKPENLARKARPNRVKTLVVLFVFQFFQ